jgi:hypothetical protein
MPLHAFLGHRLGLAAAVLMAGIGACGGESSSDSGGGAAGQAGSGGAQAGTGGAQAGSGGSLGGMGGIGGSPGGAAGMGGCGGAGGEDCVDPCAVHTCIDGVWTCIGSTLCDGGTPTCQAAEVPTVQGCMSCEEVTQVLTNAIEAARLANAACSTDTECTLANSSTLCAGDCPVAVSASGKNAFESAVSKLSNDYCSDFVPTCGYSTPKCALPTLVCSAGSCQAEYK